MMSRHPRSVFVDGQVDGADAQLLQELIRCIPQCRQLIRDRSLTEPAFPFVLSLSK
jgi:hypothetical protein